MLRLPDEPLKRMVWQTRIKAVEKEFHSMRLAADRLLAIVVRDPTILTAKSVQPASCRLASENLEGTYFIRLFAEFESGLREFWASLKRTHPQTEVLMARIASRRKIPDDVQRNANRVRQYRNHLVHQLHEPADPIAIMHAVEFLLTYFSRLPPTW